MRSCGNFLSAFKIYTKEVLRSALPEVWQTECVAGMRILPSGRGEGKVARVAHSAAGRRMDSPAELASDQLVQSAASQ
jgi:hypothetical protein